MYMQGSNDWNNLMSYIPHRVYRYIVLCMMVYPPIFAYVNIIIIKGQPVKEILYIYNIYVC